MRFRLIIAVLSSLLMIAPVASFGRTTVQDQQTQTDSSKPKKTKKSKTKKSKTKKSKKSDSTPNPGL